MSLVIALCGGVYVLKNNNIILNIANLITNNSYTPVGDQPIGEQEMKIRGVH